MNGLRALIAEWLNDSVGCRIGVVRIMFSRGEIQSALPSVQFVSDSVIQLIISSSNPQTLNFNFATTFY